MKNFVTILIILVIAIAVIVLVKRGQENNDVDNSAAGGTMLEGSEQPDNGMIGGDASVDSGAVIQ